MSAGDLALLLTFLAFSTLFLPLRLVRALSRGAQRVVERFRPPPPPSPAGPPIERIAADLRRLLAQHHQVHASTGLPFRAGRLHAVEAALSDCALDAARCLEVPVPSRPPREPLPPAQLRALLIAVSDAGVVLPGLEDFRG